MQFSADPPTHPASHTTNYGVYQMAGPAISAEVILPTGATDLPDGSRQFVTVTQTTVKDLAARFPLNEDVLTSASSSTLAGNAPPATQPPAPSGYTPPQQRRGSIDQARANGANGPDHMLTPNWVLTPASQQKSLGGRNAYDENDIPIPIPAPRTMTAASPVTPAPYYQSTQSGDSRNQKQTLPQPPNSAGLAQPSSRPQPTPLQPRGPGGYGQPEPGYPAQYTSTRNTQAPPGIQTSSSLHPSNHSPSRSVQQTIKGSPASGGNGTLLINATPKQSPSQRLHGRNGSTDTVQAVPAKSSPNYPSKSMQPITNNASQPYVSSRTDTNPTRPMNATLEYPDNGRYRSQTPAYPSTAPPLQSSYLSTQTSFPTNQPQPQLQSQPNASQHSRSMSQPTAAYQSDPYAAPPRSQTIPGPSIATVAATAPSASAIVAAYRSGNYNSDKTADTSGQRVPPRSAPSPAPTVTGRSYPAPPSMSAKPGLVSYNGGASQPPRGQTPAPPQRPAGAPPPPPTTSGTHSRSQSDPQSPPQPPRVPVAGHLSTPAPPKAQLTYHPSPSELSLLKTPSSIAPSMAKSPAPPPRPPSSQGTKPPKSSSKKGIFGLFRSRSSPPKQDARVPAPEAVAAPTATKTRQRSASQTTITAVAASVRNIISPHPAPQQTAARAAPPPRAATTVPAASQQQQQQQQQMNGQDYARKAGQQQPPVSIIAPTPVRASGPGGEQQLPPNGRRSPGTKMFTPFRLLSKHHRTVSAASVEALDGTAVRALI